MLIGGRPRLRSPRIPTWEAACGGDFSLTRRQCDSVRVSEQDTTAAVGHDLAELVPEWLDWAQTAGALGVSVSKVRSMIREHHLAAAVPVPGQGQRVPADFVHDGEVVKGLPGLLTMLHDHGYDDREAIEWIFTDDDLPGRPIDALRENRGAEVKRRAQALQ